MKTLRVITGLSRIPDGPGVYRIDNSVTGDFYIGASANCQSRLLGHVSAFCRKKHTVRMQHVFNLHGLKSFRCSMVETCDEGSLLDRERFWIHELKPSLNTSIDMPLTWIDLCEFCQIENEPYVLRVRGDHPDLNLADGDSLIVVRADKAKPGEMVVGFDDAGTRLGKFNGKFTVTGKVVSMIRRHPEAA